MVYSSKGGSRTVHTKRIKAPMGPDLALPAPVVTQARVREPMNIRGKMMKNAFVLTILSAILCALVFWLGGCSQPGETMAEGHRRHLRNIRINQQEMMGDIDRATLADKPSKLTDRRIP